MITIYNSILNSFANIHNLVVIFYLILNTSNNVYLHFLKMCVKQLTIFKGKNLNFFIILKSNFYVKDNFFKKNLQKYSTKNIYKFNNSRGYLVLYNFFLKNFKFLGFKLNLNIKTLVIKKLIKIFNSVRTNDFLPLFFKKTNILLSVNSSKSVSPITKFLSVYSFKFNKFNTVNFIKKKKALLLDNITKFKKKRKFKSFFYNILHKNILSYRAVFFIKKKNYQSRRYRKIFFLRKRFKFKRFKCKVFLRKKLYFSNKVFLKKNFFLQQFFFFKTLNKVNMYAAMVQKNVFLLFRKKLYITRRIDSKILKQTKRLTRNFFFFKRYWFNFLKKSFFLIKKAIPFKKLNTYKYINLKFNFIENFKYTGLPLTKRVFLTERVIHTGIINQYYKFWKSHNKINYISVNKLLLKKFNKNYKSKKLIFLNINKALLGKLRNTRKIHWQLFKSSKLNKRRYSNFLEKSIKNSKVFGNYNLILLFFQTFNSIFSWHHTKLLFSYNLVAVNGVLSNLKTNLVLGDLIESTVSTNSIALLHWYKKNDKKFVTRVKRWSFINYCRFINPSLKKKKNYLKYWKKCHTALNF